jgi:hypothetical protein
MDRATTIWLHADAPQKPAVGEPCNGCGVCCASEPCPIGMLASLSRRGRCKVLAWDATHRRYRCGLLPPAADGPPRPQTLRWRERLLRRWIGAGIGCDSAASVGPD